MQSLSQGTNYFLLESQCSLASLLFQNLLLEGVGLGEVDGDLVSGQLLVDGCHSVQLVLNLLSVEGIKVELDVFLSIKSNSCILSSNGGREHL